MQVKKLKQLQAVIFFTKMKGTKTLMWKITKDTLNIYWDKSVYHTLWLSANWGYSYTDKKHPLTTDEEWKILQKYRSEEQTFYMIMEEPKDTSPCIDDPKAPDELEEVLDPVPGKEIYAAANLIYTKEKCMTMFHLLCKKRFEIFTKRTYKILNL